MSYPGYRSSGFNRRDRDSYHPDLIDSNRDRDRDYDRGPPRRDSRDYRERNTRDLFEKDPRYPGPDRRESDHLRLDTRIPTGPRASNSSRNSPLSARSAPSTKPFLPEFSSEKRSATTTMSNPSPITTPASPSISVAGARSSQPAPQYRTKDAKLQQAFEAIWSLGEVSQRRSHYRFRRDKLKRELSLQQRRVEKQSEKEDDCVGLPDYQKIFNNSLNKDMEDLNKRASDSEKQYCHELERVAALLFKDSTTSVPPQQAATSITKDTPSSTLEKEFAEFKEQFSAKLSAQQKQIDEQAQKIRTLENDKNESSSVQQERADKLAERIETMLEEKKQLSTKQNQVAEQSQRTETLKDDKETLSKTIDTLRNQLDALNTKYHSLQSRVGDLETDVTRVDLDVKTQDKRRLKFESSQSSLMADKAPSSELAKLDTTIANSLSGLMKRIEDHDAARKQFRTEMDRLASQKTMANTVNGDKQVNSELKEELETIASKVMALDEDVKGLQGGMKKDVKDLKDLKDSLPDPDELDKVLNYWANHDIERTIKSPEQIVENTKQELKTLHESIANIQESITELRRTPAPAPAPARAHAHSPAPASTPAQDNSILDLIMSLLQEQENAIAPLVDGIDRRVTTLESTAPMVNKIDRRLTTLESTANALPSRIKSIEDGKFHEKYQELVNLGTRLQEDLQKAAGTDHQHMGSYGNDDEVKANLGEMKEKIEAIELCSKSLDSQWTNMQTKGMAQLILADLDPYVQKHDVALKHQDAAIRQLNAEIQEVMSMVSSILNAPKKRTASPTNGTMGSPIPLKRPRIELNGQQQQQQQQQQQRPSPSSRQSSVGQENFHLR